MRRELTPNLQTHLRDRLDSNIFSTLVSVALQLSKDHMETMNAVMLDRSVNVISTMIEDSMRRWDEIN